MRDKASPDKIREVLETLLGLWLDKPEQRLGQLVLNLCYIMGASRETTVSKLWNMDEDKFLRAIELWRMRDDGEDV